MRQLQDVMGIRPMLAGLGFMLALNASVNAKSALWDLATPEVHKHAYFTERCIAMGYHEGNPAMGDCVKRLTQQSDDYARDGRLPAKPSVQFNRERLIEGLSH